MYGRAAFAMAMAQQARHWENGTGFAVRDGKGRYFCGFEQPDGSLAYYTFRQQPDEYGNKITVSRENSAEGYDQTRPVFLSIDEMRDKGVGAAVVSTISLVSELATLPRDLKKEGRYTLVRKDLTHIPPQTPAKDWLWSPPISQSGLASADAVSAGQDRGYISLARAFGEGVRNAARTVKSTLRFGAPGGPG